MSPSESISFPSASIYLVNKWEYYWKEYSAVIFLEKLARFVPIEETYEENGTKTDSKVLRKCQHSWIVKVHAFAQLIHSAINFTNGQFLAPKSSSAIGSSITQNGRQFQDDKL